MKKIRLIIAIYNTVLETFLVRFAITMALNPANSSDVDKSITLYIYIFVKVLELYQSETDGTAIN